MNFICEPQLKYWGYQREGKEEECGTRSKLSVLLHILNLHYSIKRNVYLYFKGQEKIYFSESPVHPGILSFVHIKIQESSSELNISIFS